eukprot:g77286.t1
MYSLQVESRSVGGALYPIWQPVALCCVDKSLASWSLLNTVNCVSRFFSSLGGLSTISAVWMLTYFVFCIVTSLFHLSFSLDKRSSSASGGWESDLRSMATGETVKYG